jgi:hypothetical protein
VKVKNEQVTNVTFLLLKFVLLTSSRWVSVIGKTWQSLAKAA